MCNTMRYEFPSTSST
uniref:Uncharacterized protein n=1 Tax=Anguilla anguilla TaxID=7936 RepID=A0A0E9SGM9_ANGAN